MSLTKVRNRSASESDPMRMSWLDLAIGSLGDVVAPQQCAACDVPLNRRALLCSGCAATVVRWESGGVPLALGYYGGALASTLLRLKYAKRPDLAVPLGHLLREVVIKALRSADVDVIVPVPIPYDRLVERGYNHAALLARPLARPLAAQFLPLALGRRAGSIKQAALDRSQRLHNLKNAFFARQRNEISGKQILLVDDVSTTGATLAACSDILAACGARQIHQVVVARTESPEPETMPPESGQEWGAVSRRDRPWPANIAADSSS